MSVRGLVRQDIHLTHTFVFSDKLNFNEVFVQKGEVDTFLAK